MRISDWSSDVCSSDLYGCAALFQAAHQPARLLQRLRHQRAAVIARFFEYLRVGRVKARLRNGAVIRNSAPRLAGLAHDNVRHNLASRVDRAGTSSRSWIPGTYKNQGLLTPQVRANQGTRQN